MRAITSLPPPAAKPTTMWIGRLGYLDASSCASTGLARQANAHAPIRPRRKDISGLLEPGDVNMEHGGLAVVQCGKAAVDRRSELLRLAHAFAVGAEGFSDLGEIA